MTDKPTEFADRINYGQTVQSTRPRTTDKTTIVSRPALASLMIKRTTPVKHDTRAPEFDRIIFFFTARRYASERGTSRRPVSVCRCRWPSIQSTLASLTDTVRLAASISRFTV